MDKRMIRFNGSTLIVLFLISALSVISCAEARPWDLKRDSGLSLLYSVGYESNILELSSSDIDRFKNGDLPGPTDIQTYDDLTQDLGIRLYVRSPKWIGNRRTRLYYSLKYLSFANNSFNDRLSHSLFLTQDVTRKVDLVASYFLIPNRYLRDYYDRDFGAYYAVEFAYHLYSAGFRYAPTRELRLDARYEGYQVYYNKHFTEYDSEAHGLRAGIRYRVLPRLTAHLTLKYRSADNVGFDQAGIVQLSSDSTVNDAEYGDGSYKEEWLEYGLEWKTPPVLGSRWNVGFIHRIRHRYYTSDLPILQDPFHRGREHLQQRVMLTFSTEILPGVTGGPRFEYEWRRTDSPDDMVPRLKDYNTFRTSLQLSFALW